jgi:radical SAM superfamily enzyme YgiQ (UPF0313 family)
MTKILLLNIPSGPFPSDYPPVAISRVFEGIDPSLNCDISFFNLDYYRPSEEEIKNRIQTYSPQIIGISAILTPAYAYVKELSNFIRKNFPKVVQVLGGQMAVISNIILLKTKIDFCVVGESEPIFSNLIRRLQEDTFKPKNMENYTDIKGLVLLKGNNPYFTGYEKEDFHNGMRQFNYKLISRFTSLENYIHKIDGQYFEVRLINSDMSDFLNLIYQNNRNKNMATVFASKGCVNKCSFCHRFFKGYRVNVVDEVIDYIENMKKDLNVGMVMFAEENFGTHIRATSKLMEYFKTSGLNWGAGAVRVKTVNEQIIKEWQEAGCVHINFGIESLSQKMLDVMEKRSTVEENLNAIRLCYKHGVVTIPGLVIGMPGETEETLEETIHNLASVIPDDIKVTFEIYINYVQAIPGTPIYEYARRIGLIGPTLEDEEKYIESLYDVDANDLRHFLNFTDYEKEELVYWKYYITLELIAAYIKKHGYIKVFKYKKTRVYRIGLIYKLLPRNIRKFLLKNLMIVKYFGIGKLIHVYKKKNLSQNTKKFKDVNRSIRKIIQELPVTLREDEVSTAIFKRGH